MPVLVFMFVFTLAIEFAYGYFQVLSENLPGTISVHSLLGIVLGLFLVFRINSAYDRWWEGRKAWGGLVNSTRNMALKLNAYLPTEDRTNRIWFAKMIPNFVIATKEHLRKGVQVSELESSDDHFEQGIKDKRHKPNYIAGLLYQKVNKLYKEEVFSGDHLLNLDKEMKDFIDLIGICERIKNTPIPYSYSMYIKKFLFIYIITLPFAFVTTFGYFTELIVVLITFILLSVELISEEIEDPFGHDSNDLPTDELSVKIKDNVREILL